MASVVLRYGFKKVASLDDYFRKNVLDKGRKLCTARYVYAVEETLLCRDGDSEVTAKCRSQVRDATYDVSIQLSSQRRICNASCTCKAGLSGVCKHAAAVALWINDADRPSSTDLPQAWGRRSSKPDSSKRESIEELFGEYKPMYIGGKRPKEEPPSYVLDHFSDVNCIMLSALRAQQEGQAAHDVHDVLDHIISQAALNADLWSIKQVLNWGSDLLVHSAQVTGTLNAAEQQFFSARVACTEAQAEVTCALTITQGNCTRWHNERAVRISSSIAHRIVTRKRCFESLAQQLQNSKTPRVPAVLYGTAMEPEARKAFEEKLSIKVTQVGLVIHPRQHWLCASPDGLFQTGEGTTLLEIKCPYSRKDDFIINPDLCESFVEYVVYKDGCLTLASSHPYYCQVQVAMYVTNTTTCFFFVYSRKQSIVIVVERDEPFLSANIPKLEQFYFSFYIQQLMG